MFRLVSNRLPDTIQPEPVGAPLCDVDLNQSQAPLCRIDFQANYAIPGIKAIADPKTVSTVVPETGVITVPDLVQVDAVTVAGQTLTPAKDPTNPQRGEFVFNDGAVTIYPDRDVPPRTPVMILGGVESTPTDYVDASILSVFYGLPVVAEVRWSVSAENHPSGSINLRVLGDAYARSIAQRFRKGTELTFAGVGFSVSSYSANLINTQEAPDRLWEVSISLGGKWERKKYQRSSFLIPGYNDPLMPPYQDPDCQLGNDGRTPIRTNKPTSISVQRLASQVGVSFTSSGGRTTNLSRFGQSRFGQSVPQPEITIEGRSSFTTPHVPVLQSVSGIGSWSIPVPKDATARDTASWTEAADALKRQNGTAIDYSDPSAVRAIPINSGAQWTYFVPSIHVTYKGDCEFATGVEGYAVEYRAAKLTGKFSEPPNSDDSEDTQGEPKAPPKVKWNRRSVKVKTFKSGDEDPASPPETFPLIRNMNMCFDTSGPSKEFVEVTTHDGIEMLKTRITYGAVFNSDQVMEDSEQGDPIGNSGRKHGPVIAASASFWRETSKEVTETAIDDGTRYILGSKTTGYRLARFQQESDALEILDFIGPQEQGESDIDFADRKYRESMYRFKSVSVYAVEQKKLVTFGANYIDASKEPIPVDYEKKCHPDGTSELVPVPNPNFAEPMFAIAHLSYSNNFDHTRNPDDDPSDPLPDLTTGEERQTYKNIRILPSRNTTFKDDPFEDNVLDYDAFIERTWESSTQGAAFGEYTSRRTFSTNDGRPPAAQRMPDLYEREKPEDKEGDPNIFKLTDKEEYEYIVCTPGHSASAPSGGSIGFQYAQTLADAVKGAETDLKYRDVMESVEYSATIPTNFAIRPLDYLVLNDGRNAYRTRVISVENCILVQGQINDYPLVVAPQNTQIKAGIDRTIGVSTTRRTLPKKPEPPKPPGYDPGRNFGLTLGEILPRDMKGRGNY